MTYTILSDRTDKLLWGAGAIVVALLVLRALSLTIMRLERRGAVGERQLVRLRRGETVAALVATAIPYIAVIAVIILLASAFLPRTAAALGGSALVLILVGFGAQRFLTDVIAGALIAFERWYGIGDFVKVEPASGKRPRRAVRLSQHRPPLAER
jgi:small-conductance mechanosensitive channel